MYKNHWTNYQDKKQVANEINQLLYKFIGREAYPINDLLFLMRKVVIKYFKANPDKISLFDQPFNYNFKIEEFAGYITNVVFEY